MGSFLWARDAFEKVRSGGLGATNKITYPFFYPLYAPPDQRSEQSLRHSLYKGIFILWGTLVSTDNAYPFRSDQPAPTPAPAVDAATADAGEGVATGGRSLQSTRCIPAAEYQRLVNKISALLWRVLPGVCFEIVLGSCAKSDFESMDILVDRGALPPNWPQVVAAAFGSVEAVVDGPVGSFEFDGFSVDLVAVKTGTPPLTPGC